MLPLNNINNSLWSLLNLPKLDYIIYVYDENKSWGYGVLHPQLINLYVVDFK